MHVYWKFCPVPGITQFMGDAAAEQPERYSITSATNLRPIEVPQTIVIGGLLASSYNLVSKYGASATSKEDSVDVLKLRVPGISTCLRLGAGMGRRSPKRFGLC